MGLRAVISVKDGEVTFGVTSLGQWTPAHREHEAEAFSQLAAALGGAIASALFPPNTSSCCTCRCRATSPGRRTSDGGVTR